MVLEAVLAGFVWGTVAIVGYLTVFKLRNYLERRRIEKKLQEWEDKRMLAELQIFKEKYGYYPTRSEMLRFHDELRGL